MWSRTSICVRLGVWILRLLPFKMSPLWISVFADRALWRSQVAVGKEEGAKSGAGPKEHRVTGPGCRRLEAEAAQFSKRECEFVLFWILNFLNKICPNLGIMLSWYSVGFSGTSLLSWSYFLILIKMNRAKLRWPHQISDRQKDLAKEFEGKAACTSSHALLIFTYVPRSLVQIKSESIRVTFSHNLMSSTLWQSQTLGWRERKGLSEMGEIFFKARKVAV